MLVDIKMPEMDGMEVMRQAKDVDADLPVVVLTAYAIIHGAVKAIKAGAHDYLSKPFDDQEVIRVIHRALGERELKRRLKNYASRIQDNASLKKLMGPSDTVARVMLSEVNRVAGSDFTVVIIGETGSGKEVIARAIHQASPRSKESFIPVDCGAIQEALLESELFGHEKGAFTGAEVRSRGNSSWRGPYFWTRYRICPPGSQAKLLGCCRRRRRIGWGERNRSM